MFFDENTRYFIAYTILIFPHIPYKKHIELDCYQEDPSGTIELPKRIWMVCVSFHEFNEEIYEINQIYGWFWIDHFIDRIFEEIIRP